MYTQPSFVFFRYSFKISPLFPSKYYSDLEPSVPASDGLKEVKEHSFSQFCEPFFGLYGRYLRITISKREWDDGQWNNLEKGEFFCRVVDCTLPTLDLDLKIFSKKLKDFRFEPGQVIIELPDGETVPVFSDSVEIKEPGKMYYPFYRKESHYHISQSFSEEFHDICQKYIYPGKYISASEASYFFHRYEENQKNQLAKDLDIHRKKYEEAVKEKAPSIDQEKNWTSDELEELWKKANFPCR